MGCLDTLGRCLDTAWTLFGHVESSILIQILNTLQHLVTALGHVLNSVLEVMRSRLALVLPACCAGNCYDAELARACVGG